MATTFSERRYAGRAAGAQRDHGPAHDTSDGSKDRDGDLNRWTETSKRPTARARPRKTQPAARGAPPRGKSPVTGPS